MDKIYALAVAIILAGVAIAAVGIITASVPTISGGGGILILIGPIPIFIGGGTPPDLVLAVALVMAALVVIGLLTRRR
jgi:uncharacterized membrane protein